MIDQLLSTADKTVDSIAAAIITQEVYDDEMHIYATSSLGNNQFALNSLHEAEDMSLVDPYDREMEKYLNANVLKYFGISFDTFLGLSRLRCEKLLHRADALMTKEAQEAEDAMNPVRQKLQQRPKLNSRRNR